MINDLFSGLKKNKKKKVRGRGIGCGKGKTSGRGHKGQKSRSGISVKGFEGGQQSILTRLPKRGFNSLRSKNYSVITLSNIERFILAGKISSGTLITKDSLFALGLLSSSGEKVKIIGECRTDMKVMVDYDFISAGAKVYVDISE